MLRKIAVMAGMALLVTAAFAAAADKPVAITFDPTKKPVDLITGEKVTAVKQAQTGSVQFFINRLNEPQDYVTYFKEGVNRIPIKNMSKIVKTQEKFGIWRPFSKNENNIYPLTQNIRTIAVSFIPLDASGAPGKRVCILLNDLNEINWGNE